ncbi:MAG: hypothetical protein ACRD3D_17210, partial [Terriglobia bacterium]
MGVAYTWSKTLTDSPTDRSNAPYDTYDWALDYGPASFSRPQVFVFNYVYDLPFYHSQQGLLGHVAGGWEISGIRLVSQKCNWRLTTFSSNKLRTAYLSRVLCGAPLVPVLLLAFR